MNENRYRSFSRIFLAVVYVVLIIVVFGSFFGCSSHLQELHVFPQCQIVKIDFPMVGAPDEVYPYIVWVNTATDSLEVLTYYQQRNGSDYQLPPIFKRAFIHDSVYPVSGITGPWGTDGEGRFRLQFRVWNRWTQDTRTKWIDISKTNQPALQYKFFLGPNP